MAEKKKEETHAAKRMGFNMTDVYSKFEEVRNAILEKGPDALDRASDVFLKLHEASKEAAEFLRNQTKRTRVTGMAEEEEDREEVAAKLGVLRDECHAIATGRKTGPARMGASFPPALRTLLVQMLVESINYFLEKLNSK